MMRPTDWMSLAFDSWRLGSEASEVIALRMAKIAAGDAAAMAEAQRMVTEKMEAAAALHWSAMTGGLGSTPARQAKATIGHYRKAVAKNRARLRRGR
ncbi:MULTISPECIES: hypothetical protein [unclassified Sphingomonas]|uniref:hypothetical protein n=1 Tax=unclassified Sphingomonas TaxID=196159 RepID=UPI0006F7E547|nr:MULTISPECIES: hypothetical protein [unclassified Sphingomonas]KQX21548.1 hypothetical protein ASD17_06220 [Sphingomonas sp. Root1294]KQY72865.1 hypothetical protein ASD39_00205 [Sphingomonas sp. Root50]KRB88342.1 hypothetical protein ASE22_23235 [Sphingomonas sp. Root720]